MLAALVVSAARAYPGGAPNCNANGHQIPGAGSPLTPNGGVLGAVSLKCSASECTLSHDHCASVLCTADVCSDGMGRRRIGDNCCACPGDPTAAATPADTVFRGFLLGGADIEYEQPLPAGVRLMGDARCVTHAQAADRASVTVGIVPAAYPRKLHATVVFRASLGGHVYQLADTIVPPGIAPGTPSTPRPGSTTGGPTVERAAPRVIVGGGPGGLGAARYFESVGVPYTLYERGDSAPSSLWTDPIAATTRTHPTYAPLGGSERPLGTGIGGTQNINGAVYAPGTPEDLAASLGVHVPAARAAQSAAASFVPTRVVAKTPEWANVAMMWAPLDAGDPDDATLHSLNAKMARRSLAYGFEPVVGTVVVNTTVTAVDDTHYVVSGQRLPHAGLILAAGALQSPQLLGHDEFELLNHGYTFTLVGAMTPPDTYTFDYPSAGNATLGNTEIMDAAANYSAIGAQFPAGVGRVRVNMTMETPFKLWARKNRGLCAVPDFDDATACGMNHTYGVEDPWHYMGSVRHTNMRVDGYRSVYIGDASALQVPFNCHTSMPAAASGVLAAQALLGLTIGDTTYAAPKAPYETRALLFLAGLWVLAVGVAAHVIGRVLELPTLRGTVHYVCQPVGTVLITVAAAWSAYEREHNGAASAASEAHRIVGWTTIGLLWLNVLGGIALKVSYNALSGLGHRYSGYIIVLFLGAQAFTATAEGTGIERDINAIDYAALLGTLLLIAIANNGGDLDVLRKEKRAQSSLGYDDQPLLKGN
jgi:hypothetical protein